MQPLQNSKDRGLFGRLCAGEKKLQGKTFYLDNVKSRATMLLLEAISLLGGKIESFLHKDVNFAVTGSQETIKEVKSEVTEGGAKGTSEGIQQQPNKQESGLHNDKRRPGTPRTMPCGSRGKALLEKAICNKERLQRNNMLTNAQSWGVKILYVDDVLLYLKHLTRESFSVKHKKTEPCAKQGSPAVKATALRSPHLKIEDASRKYKPLHMQSMTFPALYYSGRFSPFESPPPPRFDKQMDLGDNNKREKNAENHLQDECQTPVSCNPSPWQPRKKNSFYCECCYQTFSNLDEHLQSDQHRSFVLEPSNYSSVDQLVTEMLPGFDPDPSQQPAERQPTPLSIHDVCELEPLTDVETEHVVQILQIEDSSFITHISDPPQSPISSRPASPSQEVHFTTPDPATSDLQPSNPENHQSTQFQSHPLSPPMPVLTLETFEHKTLSSYSDAPCLLSDPYSQPPVLSPQVPYYLNIMSHQSPYPEPPILSPQKHMTEETFEGRACEMNFADSSVSFSTLLQIPGNSAEEKRELNPEVPVGHTGGVCSRRGLECVSQSSCSSYSPPQLPTVGPNSKKRCQSSSLKHRNLKRRRKMIFRSSDSRCNASKPPNENISEVKDWSLCDNASDQMVQSSPNSGIATLSASRFVNVPDLKPSCSTFSFLTVQNFTPTPNQISSVPCLDGVRPENATSSQCLQSHSVSVCIEPALIPDLTPHSSALSDSDWDCDLLSRLGMTSATSLMPPEQNCELDKELIHRSCPWMHDTSYESHLHTVLQPSAPTASLGGEDADSSPFSRTVVQVVEVQH